MSNPALSSRRRSMWLVLVVVVAIAAGLLVSPEAASAHSSVYTNTKVPYYSNDFCVRAYGEQSHAYSIFRTEIRTARCTGPYAIEVNAIRHRAEWYADGRYCAYFNETTNPSQMTQLQTIIDQDVWYLGCNNGPGVNVGITMDTWNWAYFQRRPGWYPNYGGWPGSRPITQHCHCP